MPSHSVARAIDCTLNDPLTQAMMIADKVDRAELRDLLETLAARTAPARGGRKTLRARFGCGARF